MAARFTLSTLKNFIFARYACNDGKQQQSSQPLLFSINNLLLNYLLLKPLPHAAADLTTLKDFAVFSSATASSFSAAASPSPG
jgi:hypothetical protein